MARMNKSFVRIDERCSGRFVLVRTMRQCFCLALSIRLTWKAIGFSYIFPETHAKGSKVDSSLYSVGRHYDSQFTLFGDPFDVNREVHDGKYSERISPTRDLKHIYSLEKRWESSLYKRTRLGSQYGLGNSLFWVSVRQNIMSRYAGASRACSSCYGP